MNDKAREVFDWVDSYLEAIGFSLDRDEDSLEDAVGYVIEGIRSDIKREMADRQSVEFKRRLNLSRQKDSHVSH